jgi:PAS domain S-box-containing protein
MSSDIRSLDERHQKLRLLRQHVAELEAELSQDALLPAAGSAQDDLETPSLFVISAVDAEGCFLFIDRQGARNLDSTPGEIVGRSLYDFFEPEDADEYLRRIRQVVQDGTQELYEDSVRTLGQERWFSTVMRPLRDSNGVVVGAHIISLDVTERRQAEASIEERLRFEELTLTSRLPLLIYTATRSTVWWLGLCVRSANSCRSTGA